MDVLEVGTTVQAKLSFDGKLYPAIVQVISKAKRHAKAPVQVEFTGCANDVVEWKSFADIQECGLATTMVGKGKAKSKRKAKTRDFKTNALGPDHMPRCNYRISESINMKEFSYNFSVRVTIDKCGVVTWTETCGGFLFMANAHATFRGTVSKNSVGQMDFNLKGHWSCSGIGGDFNEEKEFKFTGFVTGAGLQVDIAPLAPPSCTGNDICKPRLLTIEEDD